MATIIGSTTRRKRRKRLQGTRDPGPTPCVEPSVEKLIGRDLCRKMVHYPGEVPVDPDTNRRKVPVWVRKEDYGLFHAFCVAHDILGTSYRPTECLYWDGSV
jgi:hypothetical protein